MNDPSYCESKAIELIVEAKEVAKQWNLNHVFYVSKEDSRSENLSNDRQKALSDYNHKMTQATSLLALAQVLRE